MISWKQWLEKEARGGEVCDGYLRKLSEAMCKSDFFDLCLDVNGMDFMGMMSAKEGGLPYDSIKEDFSRYINGQYVARFMTKDGLSYTGAMYMGLRSKDIEASETCVLILDCKDCVVKIPDYSVNAIYVDSKSKVEIDCPLRSVAYVEVFGKGEAYSMTSKNVKIIRR